ncbi:hypothetical protein QL285_022816 [Trifolium repens]|nr:hypothetical protein QL285_022816 [Trifolium repens]
MVYSIVCHLWKKSKIEKKFLPLPPLLKPPQQLPINFAIASTMGEDDDLDSDFAIASTMDEDEDLDCAVLEKSNSEFAFACFSFGNFHSEIVPIKLFNTVKPQIEGCAIKIGEIACSLASFNRFENSQSMNSTMKVQELEKKTPTVKLSISSTFVEYSSELIKKSMEIIHEVDTTIQEPQRMVQEDNHTVNIAITNQVAFSIDSLCNIGSETSDFAMVPLPKAFVMNRRDYFGIERKIRSITFFVSHTLKGMIHLDLNLVSIRMSSLLHRINNTAVETVFDPGGIISVIYSFAIMLFILSIFDSVSIFPFDPGGIFLCQCFTDYSAFLL